MKISNLSRNACVDGVAALINAGTPPGKIEIRTSAAPTETTDADAGTLLATLPMSNTAFGVGSAGVATAAAITADSSIDATGTAAHFRMKNQAGTTIFQGTVSTSGADINFDSTAFVIGGTAAITSLTLTMPAS